MKGVDQNRIWVCTKERRLLSETHQKIDFEKILGTFFWVMPRHRWGRVYIPLERVPSFRIYIGTSKLRVPLLLVCISTSLVIARTVWQWVTDRQYPDRTVLSLDHVLIVKANLTLVTQHHVFWSRHTSVLSTATKRKRDQKLEVVPMKPFY